MKLDEFAFLNQQLAAMLREGVPLEGGLRQLCRDLRAGGLRAALEQVEGRLAAGQPLAEAVAGANLPDLYKRMLLLASRSGDLPGMLSLLADYYQRRHALWTRLKGLMVYPFIVLFTTLAVSAAFTVIWLLFVKPTFYDALLGGYEGVSLPAATRLALPLLENQWVFPAFIVLLLGLAVAALWVPAWRGRLRWQLPGFREASVAHLAATLHLLLKGGLPLPEATGLVQQLEHHSRARVDLAAWQRKLSAGVTRFGEVAAEPRVLPRMFVWLVANAGEDLAGGFQRAAEIYQARARYRSELALYTALPLAAVLLGVVVLSQAYLVASMYLQFMLLLGGM